MPENYFVWAYIDPGVGSLVLQVFIASMLSVGVLFRNVLSASFARVRGRKRGADGMSEERPRQSSDGGC